MEISNCEIRNITGGTLEVDAADKQKSELPMKLNLTNFVFEENKSEFSSLVKVYENSILEIFNSSFEMNFSKDHGGAICGDY